MSGDQALQAIKQYDLGAPGKILQQVGNTRTVFRIEAGKEQYALHESNPYTTPAELQAHLRLIDCLQEEALQTAVPMHTSAGELFARVNERLWALFPWYEGEIGEDQLSPTGARVLVTSLPVGLS